MSRATLVTVTKGCGSRADAVRTLVARMAALDWFEESGPRIVIQIGAVGRSAQAVETAAVLAATLRERSPSLCVEVSDPAGTPLDADAVELQGPAGIGIRVPRSWFGRFFLVTVAAVHHHPRWRLGAALQVQTDVLARLNPRVPPAVLLAEAHRLGGADLAIACGAHRTAGEWWVASSNEVQLEGAVARAAGLQPDELPAVRVIARHESLQPWDRAASLPDLDMAGSAARAALGATRERAAAATRRAVEDARRISRTLRKVPQAIQRKLAARRGSA